MIELRLPIPPSTNNLFFNLPKGGRAPSKRYREWLIEADRWFLKQKPVPSVIGPCAIEIRVPPGRADISNLIKAPEDFLVSRKVTGDDKNNRKISIEVDKAADCCLVTIRPL